MKSMVFWRQCRQALAAGATVAAVCAWPAVAQPLTYNEVNEVYEPTYGQVERRQFTECLATLEPLLRRVDDSPAELALAVQGQTVLCRYRAQPALDEEGRAAEVLSFLEPTLRRLEAEKRGQPDVRVKILMNRLEALRYGGAPGVGARLLWAFVDAHLARMPSPEAQQELETLVRYWHGKWMNQATVLELHQRLRRALGPAHRVSLLAQRAVTYHERYLGRQTRALALAQEAWQLYEADPDRTPRLRPHLLMDFGAALSANGRGPEGLPHYLEALRHFEAEQPAPLVALARTHTHLAQVLTEMGEFDEALRHAEAGRAYALREGSPSLRQESHFIHAVGRVAALLRGDPDGLKELRAALVLVTPNEMHAGPLAMLLAQRAAQVGDEDTLAFANGYLDRQVNHMRPPVHADRALLAWLKQREHGGDLDAAWLQALPGRSQAVDALIAFELARASRQQGQLDAAIWHGKRAAQALAQHRSGPHDGPAALHRGSAVRHEADLQQLATDLVDAGRLAEAEQALRLLNDEELQSYRRAARRAPQVGATALTLNPVERRWSDQLQPVRERMVGLVEAMDERFNHEGSSLPRQWMQLTADDERAIEALRADLKPLLSPKAPPRREPAPTPPTETLPKHVARLQVWMQGDRLQLVLHRGGHTHSVRVEHKAAQVAQAVQAHRQALAQSEGNPLAAAQALYQLLLAPLAKPLQGASELQIQPQGLLRYVNFAALHDGQRWAAQRWVLSVVGTVAPSTGASSTPHQPMRLRRWWAAGRSLGDANHTPLPAVPLELRTLQELGASALLDAGFSIGALRQALQNPPDVVHLASHYRLDPASETRSYLLMGDGERLTLPDLRELPWQGVRLVVLSACESALPVEGEPRGGREWLGLADGLHRAGVPHVVATQWRVDDAASAELMGRFHRELVRTRWAQPKALAQAQRAWLRAHHGKALAHPHYWAGFIWMHTS